MRPRSRPIAALLLACLVSGAAGEEPGAVVAIVGGEVHTASGAVMPGATVLIRGDRIEAVGDGVTIPSGARRIDAKGAVVTPGLVDADGSLPIRDSERFAPRWGVDFRVADAVDRFDVRLASALAQGVTSFVVTGDARGTFPGTAAVVVNSSPAAVLEADGPIVVTLATSDVAGGVWGAQRFAEVRTVFLDARERRENLARWRRDLQKYEDKRAAEEPIAIERLLLPPDLLEDVALWAPERRAAWREAAVKSAGREKDWTKPKDVAKPPARPGPDPAADLLLAAMDAPGGRRLHFRTQTAGDVASALALAKDFGLSVSISGGEGLADHAAELVRLRLPVVVTDTADTAMRMEGPLAERAPGLLARLVAAGLRPALGTGGAGGSARYLRLVAAKQIGEGLDPEDALRSVTEWAAQSAGVADRVGAIAAGRRADVVVWDGDPFAAATKPRLVIVGGVVVFEAAR